MYYLAFPAGFVFGLFATSQIIYPILYSLPKLARLKRAGLLKRNPPIFYTLITPVIWIALTLLIVWFFRIYFTDIANSFLIGYGISAFIALIQIPKKNKDLEEDFRHSYRKYLKDESDNQ